MTQHWWNIFFSSVFSALIGGMIFTMLLVMVNWQSAVIEGAVWAWATFRELELD